MKKIADYMVTEDEIYDVLCPGCFADPRSPCTTPGGDAAANPHARRVRKAQSIKRDMSVAGCLPEHEPETYRAAMAAARARHPTE